MTWHYLGESAAIGTAALWTLSAVAWTSAGKQIGALAVSFVRLVMTCGLLMAYGQLVRGLPLPSDATARQWLVLGVSGVMGFFLADLCLFKAFLLIGPRLSLLLQSLSPPMAALIAWLWLGDPLMARQWLAMGITLAGIAWVVLEQPDSELKKETDPLIPEELFEPGALEPPEPATGFNRIFRQRGVVLAVFGAAGQAVGLVLSREGIGSYDAGAATFIRVLPAMAAYLILITLLQRWPAMMAATRHPRAMLVMSFGAVVGPFAGVVLCMIALRHCHAGVVATIIATMPVLILPFSILLYGEKVSLRAAGGAVVSVVGVAMLVL